MPNEDPRLGLPSASSFERVVECPGSVALIASLPRASVEDSAGPYADRGTRIHAALARRDPSALDEEDTELYNQALKYEAEIIERWRQDYQLRPAELVVVEERFFLHDLNTLDPIASGQPDRIYQAQNFAGVFHVLGLDYKCLWTPHLPSARKSWQIKLYIVLLANERNAPGAMPPIRFAHCKPMKRDGANDWVDFYAEDVRQAEAAIRYHLWLAKQENASRHAGQWCQYCPGKTACPEAAAMALLPSVVARQALPSSVDPEEMVAALSNEDLLKLWRLDTITRKILDAVDARLKTLPKAELDRLGLELPAQGKVRDKVFDVRGAFAFLRDKQFIPEAKLWLALGLTKGKVSEILQTERTLAKKWADKLATELLADFSQRTHDAPSLKEIKGI